MSIQDKTKQKLQQEFKDLQHEFIYLNEIKNIGDAKRKQLEQELSIALQEIDFQNIEKEKRAAELIIANLELTFQNKEKVKRAAELVIANIELVFQNKEKARRAAELVIANKELSYQNEEKEERAAELTIANKELTHQNELKEKRAKELIIASKELVYQKKEKANRAKELKIAGLELIIQEEEKKDRIKESDELRLLLAENSRYVAELLHSQLEIQAQSEEIVDRNEKLASTIEELFRAKEKAEESDRLKSAFLANMSHEIRTPMNGILGFTDILSEADLSGEEKDKYIKIIQNSGNRLLSTVNDIIDISKIEAGQMEVSSAEFNIGELLEQTHTFFSLETKKKGLELILNTNAQSQNIISNSDQEKINAILTNLIKNAIKFTPSGKVEFGYQKLKSEIQFFVKDTGIGISKKGLEVIFDRFRRISNEEGFFSEGGSGLGLAITKAYIDMLGGKIWVESKKGAGTQFYFTIPYEAVKYHKASSKEVDSEVEVKTNAKASGLKILIAEDDESSIEYLKIIVENISSEIIHVLSGKEAVNQMQKHSDIDLILMDINMPGMDGYEATVEIRKFNKEVLIIAQTAYALAGDQEKAIEAGCNDYISKPIKKADLLEKINKSLGKK